jgi:hypothetical protein
MKSGRSVTSVVLVAAVASVAALPCATAGASTPLTKAHAKTIAKHINVRHSDFPRAKVHPAPASSDDKKQANAYQKCVGLAMPFAQVNSPAFDTGKGSIYSSVTEFVSTRAIAKRDSHRAASAKARTCLRQELNAAASQIGASKADVTLTPITVSPVAGIDVIYGTKYTVKYSVFGFSGTLHGWDIGFSRGNAEVSLNEIGTADVPVSNLYTPLNTLITRAKSKVPAKGFTVQH